jgi:periplasmic protein TonB
MLDQPLQSLTVDKGAPPVDWHAAAPTIGLRWFIAAALLMPFLLVAGVFWIHQLPPGLGPSVSDSVVEVRLITAPDPIRQSQEASLQPGPTPARPSEPLLDDPVRAIPEDAIARPPQAEPGRVLAPAASAPASAPPASSPTLQTAALFQRTLLSHIARYRHYPDQARRDRVQGTVQLVFAMRRDGTVTDVWVKTSSGHNALDRAAVDTIHDAQPLPRIPTDLPGQLNISMPVAFNLP